MSDQDTSSPNENAVITESAPVNEASNSPAEQPAESAPAPETPVVPAEPNTENQGAEPEQSKAVKELITQRKRRQEAEKEAAYLRGQLDALQKPNQGQQDHQQQAQVNRPALQQDQMPVEPDSNNYDTYEEWEVANRRYMVDLAKYELRTEVQQTQIQAQRVAKQQTFQQKMETAGEKDPSIFTLMEDRSLPLHQNALPILYESDVAPELLKALDADRKEATRIFQLFNTNPILGARELGKLESRIINTPKPAPPKKVSQAPEPISPVTPTGAGVVDEDSLPMDQWVARRNKQVGYR